MTSHGEDRRQHPRIYAGALCLLFVLGALPACARMDPPPGGPPDNIPPVVVSAEPDTFSVLQGPPDAVTIRFNERISERPQGGTVADAVTVSPATSQVRVDFRRQAIEVTMAEGFEAGRVYRVRVHPVVVDMFANPMVSPFELVFSTGPGIAGGAVAGVVRDRLTGEAVSDFRVHARPAGDSTEAPYVARTTPEGVFALRYLPAGGYDVVAFDDRDRDAEVSFPEPRAGTMVSLAGPADTVVISLATLAPDTTPPVLSEAEAVDSVSLRIAFDDYLDPEGSLDGVEASLSRDGGAAPVVDSLFHPARWEARRAALADAAAALADTAAPADTAAIAPGGAADAAAGGGAPDAAPPPDGAGADGAGADQGLGAPDGPLPAREIYGVLSGPLESEVEYELTVTGVTNIQGTAGGGGVDTLTWTPPPPDTTSAPGEPVDGDDPAPDADDPAPDADDPAPDADDPAPDAPDAPPDADAPGPDAPNADADGPNRG